MNSVLSVATGFRNQYTERSRPEILHKNGQYQYREHRFKVDAKARRSVAKVPFYFAVRPAVPSAKLPLNGFSNVGLYTS